MRDLIGWTAGAIATLAAIGLGYAIRVWGFGDCCPHDVDTPQASA
ncbi:hypothetical protein [Blastococcus mobilis]|uniref:Uncharacterized protein n=1 Tax=Blastococcus mobilis TaxID=1938746 RepID=A0A238VFG2_9ACTN|nr:hypothetical protein [Blastococcus mobilis]SNR32904.1 hypothetical protein SAMN06272737_10366 [Blastococcus mobilis]